MTKLSVIITTYNVENHMKQTLNSMTGQTSTQFELIIVDDGSTDDTLHVAEQMLQESHDIDYKILAKENGGVSSARNLGLMNATGEYVIFLDGDDYAADNLIESISASLRSQEPDMICWGYDTVKTDQTVLKNYFDTYQHMGNVISGAYALKYMLIDKTMWICTGSAAYRKALLYQYKIKYEEGCSNGEDQEFTIKALARSESVVLIDETLSFYVKREGSISNSCNFNRFDAIGALTRTRNYLKHVSDKDLGMIADMIETSLLAENYFNNLESCINGSNISRLLNQMKEQYPELNLDVRKALKAYDGKNRTIKIKCKLYLISPGFYSRMLLINRWLKSIRK